MSPHIPWDSELQPTQSEVSQVACLRNLSTICSTLHALIKLRTPISIKQTQLCTRSNVKVVRQQRTTGDYYASRR